MKNLVIAKLQKLSLANQLPHAWLLSGPMSQTKTIAEQFSKWLLCQDNNKSEIACDTCKSCCLFNAKTHPDFCLLAPQEQKTTISIDEVRVLPDFVTSKPQFSTHKVVLIYPAEAMQKQAANSLLKSLEEPSGNTKFFLLTKHPDLLLKTIVSRCQVLKLNGMAAIESDVAKAAVLQIINDLNGLWVQKSSNPIKTVEQWLKLWPNDVLLWLELAVVDLLRFKYTQNIALLKYLHTEQLALGNSISSDKLWSFFEKLRQAQYWFATNHKPNLQLLLEDMLVSQN